MKRHVAGPHFQLALLAALVAGCFTDPINHPPTVMPPSLASIPLYHGQPATFTVSATDADGDTLTADWGSKPGGCPAIANVDPQTWPQNPVPIGEQFVVPSEATGVPFCVCTFVTDSHNASRTNCLAVVPDNQQPVAVIFVKLPQAQSPYPLHSKVQLSVQLSDPDGDQPTIVKWTGYPMDPPPCAAPDAADACFVAEMPGMYQVSVDVEDGYGGKTTATLMPPLMFAPDRLPCITMTTPKLSSLPVPSQLSASNTFYVDSVSDDGSESLSDPMRSIHFTWYEGPESGPLLYLGNDLPQLTVAAPDPSLLGQTRRVRVEVDDSVNTAKIKTILQQCGDADACTDPAQPACALRDTWKVSYRQ